MTTTGYAVMLCIITEYKRRKVVNIMWIIIILFMVADVMFVWSMMKVASFDDDQSERWAMEHGKDGKNG